jgi:hypothetical protein
MEWIWVGLLFLIMFGPIVLLLVRRKRGEKLSQGPDELAEAYRQPPTDFTLPR